jgi:transcriptional regulator with XRE-family HTH domain
MLLQNYRTKHKLTLSDMAETLGLSNGRTIQRYESGERFPMHHIIEKIKSATNGAVTYDDFAAIRQGRIRPKGLPHIRSLKANHAGVTA